MIRPTVLVATLVACGSSANAQAALERGKYLVNTIMACGNCHTPKDSNGTPILERELSGGLTFTIPPFNGAAANITPDRETGIGDWSDDDIKRAITHGARPANARLPGVPLAAVMAAGMTPPLGPKRPMMARRNSWTESRVVSSTKVARARSALKSSRSRRIPSITAEAPFTVSGLSGCGRRVFE
jgi:hypothetical protein